MRISFNSPPLFDSGYMNIVITLLNIIAASCVDTFDEGDCQALKFNGFCQTEKEIMYFYCLKTCFYCV